MQIVTNSPKISVLMSVYNGVPYLKEAVTSILQQTFSDFEFIVVDDNSSDETPVILDSYDDPRLVRLHNKTNMGLTRSLNRGLAVARGKYVARQDADDVSLPDRFVRQAAFLDEHQDIAAVGSAFIQFFEDGRSEKVVEMPLTNEIICDRLFYDHCFCHGSIMMRRSCLEAVNGYDEHFKTAQDRDLWLRLAERYSLANLPEPLYKLRIHASSVTGSKRAQQRQAARQAVLNTLERDVLHPTSVALARFYWQAAIDEITTKRISEATHYLHHAITTNKALVNDVDYLIQTTLACAFEAGPGALSHKKSIDDVASGLSLLNNLFTLLPTELNSIKKRRRQAIAELHAAYAFTAFHHEQYTMALNHSLRAWVSYLPQLQNRGLRSVFIRSLWRYSTATGKKRFLA